MSEWSASESGQLHLVHEPRLTVLLTTHCEYLTTCLSDQQSLLELSRAFAVQTDRCPVVRPLGVSPVTGRNHWLNGESVAGFHDPDGFVVGVMRHVWRSVEEAVDAVTTIGSDHAETMRRDVALDHVSYLAESHARFDL